MDDRAPRNPSRSPLAAVIAAAILAAMPAARASADDAAPFAARQGLELASAAAQSWSADAVLVYVENDEALDGAGVSPRWSYPFFSPSQDRARVGSVQRGKIGVAEHLH